jgi:hypothetical protein
MRQWRRSVLTVDQIGEAMAEVGGIIIPRFVWTLIWIVVIVLVIIGLAWIVHKFGGGTFIVKLGHFSLEIGVN